jgi:hypothetical protein
MRWFALLGCLFLALVGCAAPSRPAREWLSLSAQQPTFVFFYTDN